jgi:glycosyltransferase involved in cell wall biosynthesis
LTIGVSLICTVKNEEATIEKLLISLLSQTRSPDEIIIVDGGSVDNTRGIIDSYIQKGAPFRLILSEGANIAQGRNIAIRSSRYEIMASTDAGCELETTWLERLVKPFEEDSAIDVVSGAYRYSGRTYFEQAVARIISRRMPMMDGVILPASRSIAFKKSAWQLVDGYPEYLQFAEDTTFDYNLRSKGCNFGEAKDAITVVTPRENAKSLFRQYFNYSKWDMIAKNHNSKGRMLKATAYGSMMVILALIIGLNTPMGLLLSGCVVFYYIFRYGVLLSIGSKVPQDVLYGPLAVMSIMLGEFFGTISGILVRE